MSTEVARDVLVVDTRIAQGKAGVIGGEHVALAVDAGIDDEEGAAVLAAARSLDRPVVRLVLTHGHADHALGSVAFRGSDIIGRPGIVRQMREQLADWADRRGMSEAELDARLGWPTVIVKGEATIDLGGRTVRLLDTPGHAPDALCVLDPEHGVLFGGDTVVTAIPPAFTDGNGSTLERTLRWLAELEVETLIPGHGDVVHGREAVRDAIVWSADYLAACRSHVSRNAGRPVDELVASAPFDDFIGDHLPRDRHRMEWRHAQTIRTIEAEMREAAGLELER
jgi:glyoxylase-like metal-dependent hydrolase (beta-lactamase superfamily II)